MNKSLLGLIIVMIGTAQAGNLTVPNDFTPNTPALADEVNENFAATEAAVNDNDARISTLEGGASYALSSLLNDFSSNLNATFTRVNNLDNFFKSSDDTRVEVYLYSRIQSGVFASGATIVQIELRVDNATGGISIPGAITSSGTIDFISAFALFEGLPAGNHTVSLWARTNAGTSTGFVPDPGGWGGRILVKEVQ